MSAHTHSSASFKAHPQKARQYKGGLLVFRMLRSFLALLSFWQDRSRQRRKLMALDDCLLSDIGRSREDVDIESRKPFWR